MWERSLLIFASDNGAPMLPYASNLPLRGGKNDAFDGGVRTLAALGGGWLPRHMRGATSDVAVHISDWYATLSGLMGVPAADPPIRARIRAPCLPSIRSTSGRR